MAPVNVDWKPHQLRRSAGTPGAAAGLVCRRRSSRLTLESNYNDRRRNPSPGVLPGEACPGGAEYAHAGTSLSLTIKARAVYLHPSPPHVPPRPPTPPRVITQFVRATPSHPAVFKDGRRSYGGGDGGVDSPTLFISVSFFLFRNWLNLFSYGARAEPWMLSRVRTFASKDLSPGSNVPVLIN
ncbi:unnamed protein product, partial [Iphiclides podalirius]